MIDQEPMAAYIHVPFCASKCGYCDFASVEKSEHLMEDYVAALETEMAFVLDAPRAVRTIFIGGGTPTYLPEPLLRRTLTAVRKWFPATVGQEFTVETNPNTLDEGKVTALAEHGVNRVSVGAQSFNPESLRKLERNHDPDSVAKAVEMLREVTLEISLDMIFGVPGQSLADWQADLERALVLRPAHLSAYCLTFEKGTRLWRQRRLGMLDSLPEETERAMFEWVLGRMRAAGFEHYEISNYALRPASRCRHNLTYWHNRSYWGFGTGAAAYVGGTRTLNFRDVAAYVGAVRSGNRPIAQRETLDPRERALETVMLNLRLRDGVDRVGFHSQTGFDLDGLCGHVLKPIVGMGLLADDGATIALSDQGLFVADSIFSKLLGA